MDDAVEHSEGPAEALLCRREVTARNQAADARAADGAAAELDGRADLGAEAVVARHALQHAMRALAAAAEGVIRPRHEDVRRKGVAQEREKVLRRAAREVLRKRDGHEDVDAEFLDELAAQCIVADLRRHGLRREDGERMVAEGEDHALAANLMREVDRAHDDAAVAAVDAVKHAECDDEARVVLPQRGESGIELHRVLLSHGFAASSRWMTLAGMTSWLARS